MPDPIAPPAPPSAPPVAPPPPPVAAAPRAPDPGRPNYDEKLFRQEQLRLKQREQALQQESAAVEQRKREAQALIEEAKRVRDIGPADIGGMFERLNIPPDEQMKRLSAWQMQLMSKGKIDPSADAPVAHVTQRLTALEQRIQERDAALERRAEELAAQQAEFREQQWYGEIQRQTTLSPECRLTKLPILLPALDQELRQYQEETKLAYGPVFNDRAKAVELQLAGDLAGAGYFRIEGTTVFGADGSVKGTFAEAGAAPGPKPEAVPGAPGAPAAEGQLPATDEQDEKLMRGIGSPGVKRPAAAAPRSLDTQDSSAPGAPQVWGRVKSRDSDSAATEYEQILAQQRASQGGAPQH
jgi:hypothetical protein